MAYLSTPKTARYSFSSLKSCYAQFCFYFGSRLRTSIASFAITYIKTGNHKSFYKEHMYGKAYFVNMVDKEKGQKILNELDSIMWEY